MQSSRQPYRRRLIERRMSSFRTNAVLLAGSILLCLTRHAGAATPNIVVIMADDLGYADVGFQGCEDISTPHLDQLAADGARFSNGYVTGCTRGPSRAGFITGKVQSTFGYYVDPDQPLNPKQGLPPGIKSVAQHIQCQGYVTGGVGKWHMGTAPHQHPNALGYADWFGFLGGGSMYPPLDHPSYEGHFRSNPRTWSIRDTHHTLPMLHNSKAVEWRKHLTRELTDAGIRFIEKNSRHPFFLFVAYNAPHENLDAPAETIAQHLPNSVSAVPGVPPESRQAYAAMVDELDLGVGRLIETLEELELSDNTIIWFLSDHGGMKRTSDNRPLRGAKRDAYEGGLRVPLVVRWPTRVAPGAVLDHPVTSLDIGATSLALAGGDLNRAGLHGSDITAYITGESTDAPHDVIYWHTGKSPSDHTGAMREGRFKLVLTAGEVELFDLESDPAESKNLVSHEPRRTRRMVTQWTNWNKANRPPLWLQSGVHDHQFAGYEWLKGTPHYQQASED